MQQRQLRLGDILDDYCPRERRVTNHVIVAMIGDDVKQTRCTTCDADHEYKHAKVPRQRRKTETPAALYAQVLADRSEARDARAAAGGAAGNARDGHARRRADRIRTSPRRRPRSSQPRSAEDGARAADAGDADGDGGLRRGRRRATRRRRARFTAG